MRYFEVFFLLGTWVRGQVLDPLDANLFRLLEGAIALQGQTATAAISRLAQPLSDHIHPQCFLPHRK